MAKPQDARMTDWQTNLPPGTRLSDIDRRDRRDADEDEAWWSWWYEDQRLRWEEAMRREQENRRKEQL